VEWFLKKILIKKKSCELAVLKEFFQVREKGKFDII
jgi:hypothetical protein